MDKIRKTYFVADVHLGLEYRDPVEREARFLDFLRSLGPENAGALYLLGDIWDFWYEYRDVVPKQGIRVVSELIRLVDAGVRVFFFEGNHDIWTYSFFESLGMVKMRQPAFVTIGDRSFCLGHGDGLGDARRGYRILQKVFRSKLCQALFGSLHPRIAFGLAMNWSNSSRRSHSPYHFGSRREPLQDFALEQLKLRKVDYFVFGHFHDKVDMELPGGSRLVIIKDWMDGGQPHLEFDGENLISF